MQVNKAIILTAGYSTRFLPVCKSIPKPMLPLLEVPIIHELVKECLDGGIKDIIIVTSFGNNPVEDYFDSRPDLENFLERTGKQERFKRFEEVFGKVNVTCVRQNRTLPYGNGSAVLAAKPWIGENEPFAILYGDDMVLGNTSAIGELKSLYEETLEENSNLGGVIGAQEIEREEVYKYGVLKFKDDSSSIIESIVEKPPVEEAPSNLVSFGRFIMSYDIFKYLDINNTPEGELFFSEAVGSLCHEKDVYVGNVKGEWLTTGDPLNYLKTQIKYAMTRDEYANELKSFLETL